MSNVIVQSMVPRAPDVLRDMATGFDVVNNFAFLPHRRAIPNSGGIFTKVVAYIANVPYELTALLTLCNCYVSVFTAALLCPIPPMKANDQLKWLGSNEGKMAGWTQVDAKTAVARAGLGYPTVVVAEDKPKGHIGMVMPSPVTDPNMMYVSAAGASNFVYDKAVKSFGAGLLARALYFTHN